jgi:hypothetical protein
VALARPDEIRALFHSPRALERNSMLPRQQRRKGETRSVAPPQPAAETVVNKVTPGKPDTQTKGY